METEATTDDALEAEVSPAVEAPTDNGKDEASLRAEACSKELDAVLKKHACELVAQLDPVMEPVGVMGNRAIISVGSIAIRPLRR